MRVIGIVPARMESARFPGKPLALIAGRPMLRHVIDAVARSRMLFPYFIASPDLDIAEYCKREHLPHVVTTRACRNGTERVSNALRQIAQGADDIVMNVQGDEPMIKPESLDRLALAFEDRDVQIASLCYRPRDHQHAADRNRVKVILTGAHNAFAFTRKALRPGIDHFVHVGVYAYRLAALAQIAALPPAADLEQTAWLRAGFDIKMIMLDYEPIAVDCPADLAAVARILEPA